MKGDRRGPARAARLCASAILVAPAPVLAHSFGQVYRLPVPVWLYLYGACAALALSFLVMAFFLTADAKQASSTTNPTRAGDEPARVTRPTRPTRLLWLPATVGVSLLGLCIASGLFGVAGPYANFSMTAFWIVFLLGLTYLVALVGDVYRFVNPWRALVRGLGWLWRGFEEGRFRYPERLAYWPALGFYVALVWLELFGDTGPFSLAIMLLAYTAINLVAAGLFGARDWFRYGELFGVFFSLIGRMAPRVVALHGRGVSLKWRAPFSGLRHMPIVHNSLLLFILFMLSSTAFDGLHETQPWRRLFWVELYPAVLSGWVGSNPIAAFPTLLKLYAYWNTLWLVLSPLLYFLVYGLFVVVMRWMARSELSATELARRFAPSLLPIAFAYHVSHYYTLLQTQGLKIVPLASDPLGYGWNLFGTADWWQRANAPEPTTVWHVQVGVIVLGHIVGVYLSHAIALDLFGGRWRAARSQLPMLALMLAFTAAGLWILAQPIAG